MQHLGNGQAFGQQVGGQATVLLGAPADFLLFSMLSSFLMQDLFSELAAPAQQQQQPQGYGQTGQQVGYGQMGQLYGQQMGGPGAGFPGAPASVFPYPYAQPVPPGYQPFMLANPAAGAPQQPQLQSFPSPDNLIGFLALTYDSIRYICLLAREHSDVLEMPLSVMRFSRIVLNI